MSPLRPGALTLSAPLFAVFSQLVEAGCGVHYRANDRQIFAAKLESHALDLGYDSLLDYYYRLRYDDPGGIELQKLIEATLVHETYFFRELPPLVQLVKGHLTETIRTRGRARVWSAACSTGEEPLTLAMLLDKEGLLDRVEIVASDVSANAIGHATIGHYGRRALRDGHPVDLAVRYLVNGSGGFTVAPRIREAVRFQTINLLKEEAVRGLGLFDVIMCRNVLIYFQDDEVSRVVDRLARSLEPEGVIAVGVSESLMRFGTAVVLEERDSSFFYRRAR